MNRKRPLIITLICLIGFTGALASIPMAFSKHAEAIGRIYPALLLLSTAFGFVCFTGLWMMKRWSVVAYAALAGMVQVMLFSLSAWSMNAILLPGIVIAIGLFYFDRMES